MEDGPSEILEETELDESCFFLVFFFFENISKILLEPIQTLEIELLLYSSLL